jgi:hypothetical protein
MTNRAAIQERYLRDDIPIRLGGLAANLARIKSFSDHPGHMNAVERLIEESKFFIEWTALDTAVDIQAELVKLQVKLALWHLRWQEIWEDPERRAAVMNQAGNWSRWVLERSGFMERSPGPK